MTKIDLTAAQAKAMRKLYKSFLYWEGEADRIHDFYSDLPDNSAKELEEMGLVINCSKAAYYKNKNCVQLTPKGLEAGSKILEEWVQKYKDTYIVPQLHWNDLSSAQQKMLDAIGLLGGKDAVSMAQSSHKTQVCIELESLGLITYKDKLSATIACSLTSCGEDLYYRKR